MTLRKWPKHIGSIIPTAILAVRVSLPRLLQTQSSEELLSFVRSE
jgi:hypothetical protein